MKRIQEMRGLDHEVGVFPFDPLAPLTWPLEWGYGMCFCNDRSKPQTHWYWWVARRRPDEVTADDRLTMDRLGRWAAQCDVQQVDGGDAHSASEARQEIIATLRRQRLLLEEWMRSPQIPYHTEYSNAGTAETGTYDPTDNSAAYVGSYTVAPHTTAYERVDVW